MLALLLALGCCLPSRAVPAEVRPTPFLVSPVTIATEVGHVFDHGSREPGRGMLFDGRLIPSRKGHFAYDFPMPVGTPVVAAADGTVVFAADTGSVRCDGFDSKRNVWIKLDHGVQSDGARYLTRYYHLSELLVAEGQRVAAGARIGLSGNTGCSTGPHLHFSVARVTDPGDPDGYPVDPYGWTGAGPDPRANAGKPSAPLWRDGRAPPLVRYAGAGADAPELGVVRITWIDALAPVAGEWVEVGVRRTGAASHALRGWHLRNRAGDDLVLPDVTLAPGEVLRVWTRRDAVGKGEISWGLDHEAWADEGDCATLVDPQGAVAARLAAGEEGCRGGRPRSAPREDAPDGEQGGAP